MPTAASNLAASLPRETVPRRREPPGFGTPLFLAAGMALLIGMLIASYLQASAGLDALTQFGVANQRVDRLDRLNQLLLQAQSSVRGYALTRSPAYLETYRATVPLIHDTLAVIEHDHSGGPYADSAGLVASAQTAAALLDLTTRHIQEGATPQATWFTSGTAAMEAYHRRHAAMKVDILTENLRLVRQSFDGFENARISTIMLAIASLLLLILSISQHRKRLELQARLRQLLEAENERLEHEVSLRTTELTGLATYLTDVRETEKQHLARELHDELGALLTAAKLDADWIERKLPPEARTQMAQRLTRLRQSLTSVITLKRRIINDLRPALLYDLGLVDALRALIDEFAHDGSAEVSATLPDAEPELPEDVSLSLFRIVQEALTNIRKYSQARHVRIALALTPVAITLSVADDGIGFDLQSPKLARQGLAGIKHRVYTHGGRLDIRTAPGRGVTIHATLPLAHARIAEGIT